MSSLGCVVTRVLVPAATERRTRGRLWSSVVVFVALVIGLPALGAAPAQAVDVSAYSWVRTGGAVQPKAGAPMVVFHTSSSWGVLAAGGNYSDGSWIYNPSTGKWAAGPVMSNPRLGQMVTLDDGRVMVAGGDEDENGNRLTGTYQLYNPATNKWSAARGLPGGVHDTFGFTKISDGRVLLVGGSGSDSGTDAFLFDPVTNTWSSTGSLHHSAVGVATLLPDGRVFATGYRTAEIWDPATGQWTIAQAPADGWPASQRTAVLPDGRVMITFANSTFAQIYDPTSSSWATTATFPATGVLLSASLENGLVLLLTSNSSNWNATSFYNVATGNWLAGPDRFDEAGWADGVLLPSGEYLLVQAGSDSNSHSYLLVQGAGPQDTTAPTVEVASPAADALVAQGSPLLAEFTCADPAVEGQPTSGVGACEATVTYRDDDDVFVDAVANGGSIDTAMLGWHRLHVAATDEASNTTSRDVVYTVVVPTRVPEVTWVGRLLTPEGVPAAGVDVSLSALSSNGVSVCGRDEVCTVSRTDAQGRFSLTVEARTDDNPIDYQLRLDRVAGSGARAGEVVLPVFSLGQGTISDLVADRSDDITLPALRKVTAQVQDAAGEPVADALVRLPKVDQSDEPPMTDLFWSPGTGDESAATRTDAQGEATFYTFGSSTPIYLEAVFHNSEDRAFSAFRSVTVTDTDATVVLRQPDAVTWSGHVLTTDGVPVSGVDVSASALSQDGHPICGTDARCAVSRTDTEGRFAVTVEARSGDNPVDYQMELGRAAGAGARASEVVLPLFRVGLGTVTDFMSDRSRDVTMPSLVRVTVQTVDADGAPVPGVELRLPEVDQSEEPPMSVLYWTPVGEDGESSTTHTDAQGGASFYSLSSTVPLVVEARFPLTGGGTVSSFRTVVAETGDATLTIKAPGMATLSGRVLTTDGVPASGVDVSLSALSGSGRPLCGDDQTCAVSRTDAEGRYSLTVEARSEDNPVVYQFSVDREAGAQARAGEIVLPVFHLGRPAIIDLVADRAQDLTLPALVRVATHVQDARGEVVRGVTLHLGAVDQSDEPPMTALYWSPASSGGESSTTITGDNSDAVFYSFGSSTPLQVRAEFPSDSGAVSLYRSVVADTDTTLEVQAPDGYFGAADTDNVSDAVEDNVPSLSGSGTGDGNGDGIPDSEQDNVASVPSYGSSSDYVTIASPAGTGVTQVVAVDPSSLPTPPADVALPRTLTSFAISDIPTGTLDETVSIYIDSTAGVEGYAKYDQDTGWTLLPEDRFVVVDAHRIDITLTDGGIGDADGVVNGSIDDPGGPVWGSLATGTPRVSDTTPEVGEQLSVNEGTWGAEDVTFAYQWIRTTSTGATTDIAGATSRKYTVTADDLGCTLRVKVIGSSAGYLASAKTSAATAKVRAGALSPTPTPSLDSSTPVTDQVLSVVPGEWGPDGVTLKYQWYRRSASGTVKSIPGATGEQYTVRASDVSYRLRVKVTGSLAGYTSVSKYSGWTSKVAKAPFVTAPVPRVDGVVRVGMPLTAVPGSWDPSATFKYQWYRVAGTGKSTAISGATKATYKLTSTDQGKVLKVRVTGYRSGYVTTARYSDATSVVLPPMAGSTPRIDDTTPVVDQELTVDEGVWTPAAPETTFSYQWYAKSSSGRVYKIAGATARSYQVEGRYAGYKVKLAVTGTATGYAPVTKTSAYTSSIAKAKFTPATPAITGTAQVGQTLLVAEGDWQPTPSFSYQWYRSGTAITGATANTYLLVGKDLGKAITVKVTAKRTGYTTASRTSDPTTAVTA